MKQTLLLKLSAITVILFLYLFLFDPSTKVFITSIKNLLDLNFSIRDIFIFISWIIGFIGILSLLNIKNNKLRIMFWTIFIISYVISFLYLNIFKENFTASNIERFGDIFDQINAVHTGKLIKFILGTVIFFAVCKFVNPVGVDAHKYFIMLLCVISLCSVFFFTTKSTAPMQAVYIVPFSIIYKLLLELFIWLKSKVGFSV